MMPCCKRKLDSTRRPKSDSDGLWRPRWLPIIALLAFVSIPYGEAFSATMTYKPPVKSSVNKIRTSRQSRTSTSHKSAYAGALAPPVPTSQPRRSFEKRMRDLVLPHKRPSVAPASTRPANLVTVRSLLEYKKVVADEKDRIVAVRFHSPYCRACKAVAPLYYHLASQHPNTLFVDVPATPENANLHQGLGVPSLPYGHIYQPGVGLVEELRMVKKQMPEFEEKLCCLIQRNRDAQSSQDSS